MANIVADVQARFRADTSDYVTGVRTATKATQQLMDQQRVASDATSEFTDKQKLLAGALAGLGALAFAKAYGAVKKYAMQGIQAAKQYEQTVISMEGIFQGTGMSIEDAATKTQQYLAELRDFAAKTPFELPQTLDAVKRLLSIGYAADDVKDRMLPAIGDLVAALGQPPQAISAVVYAMGQMKSAGRVMTQDLMQIGTALPGFNARMEIAKQLFNGDMMEMSKAVEAGALSSEQAIDVLIKAMQEFPGASGAMVRQSGTLAGVMSTFSDTVNNALIDGLMPAMPKISAALNNLMPAVEDMAVGFASELGPALVEGIEALMALAPTITAVIPPLLDLSGRLTVVADLFIALSPVIIAAAEMASMLMDTLQLLPGPVFMVVAAFLTFRVALKKLGIDVATFKAGVITNFKIISLNVKMAFHIVRTEAALAGASLTRMSITARTAGLLFIGTLRAMGAAVKAFMVSLGPVGIAFAAVAVAMEIFMGKSAAAETLVANLKATIDETTGAFTQLSYEAAAKQLAMDISREDLDRLASMGISLTDMAKAAIDGGTALSDMQAKLDAAIGQGDGHAHVYATVKRNVEGLAKASEETRRQVEQDEAAKAAAAEIASQETRNAALAAGMGQLTMAAEARKAYGMMTEDQRKAADQVALLSRATQQENDKIKASFQGLGDAAGVFLGALERINIFLNKDAAKSAVINGWRNLTNAIEESKGSITSYTEEGDKARSAVRTQIQNFVAYAESIKDPGEKAEYLREQVEKLNKRLSEAGVPKSQREKMLGPVRDAISDAQKAVTDAKDAAAEAKENGIDLGEGLTSGIIEAIQQGTDPLLAVVQTMGDQVKAKLMEMWGIASPSKFTMWVGSQLIAGLVKGMSTTRGTFLKEAERTAREAKLALGDAKDAVFTARQQLATAMKEGTAREQAAAERDLERAIMARTDAVEALAEAEAALANVREKGIPEDILAQSLEAAASAGQTALDKLKEKASAAFDLFTQTRDAMISFAKFTSLQAPTGAQPSAGAYLANMKERLATIRKFGQALERLRGLKLNKAVMADIISAGPESGLAMAEAILAAGAGMVQDINITQGRINRRAGEVGDTAALSGYGMTGAEAQGVVTTNVTLQNGAVRIEFGKGTSAADRTEIEAVVTRAITKAFRQATQEASRR